MAKYRNRKTGLVQEVPETAPTRTERRGRDKQWASKLARMARSKRWERVPDSTKVGKGPRPKRRAKTAKTIDIGPEQESEES